MIPADRSQPSTQGKSKLNRKLILLWRPR